MSKLVTKTAAPMTPAQRVRNLYTAMNKLTKKLNASQAAKKNVPTLWDHTKKALGYGAATAGLAGTASLGYNIADAGYRKARHQGRYDAMLEVNPSLKRANQPNVKMLYGSIARMSPDIAADPLIAGSLVRSMLSRPTEGGLAMDIQTAKTLADTQKSLSGSGVSVPNSVMSVMSVNPKS